MEYGGGAAAAAQQIALVRRAATEADLERICDVEAGAYGEAFSTAEELPRTQVVEMDDILVGKIRMEEQNGIYGIYGLAVRPDYQGRGIGGEVLARCSQSLSRKAFSR